MADTPQLTPIAAGESAPLLIDQLMPNHHARREELIVVHADAGPCYAAVRDLDFLAVHSPLADAATWARSIPNRIAVATGRREPSPPPPSMRLADLFDRPPEEPRPTDAAWMWMPLGEDRGREIVFGAVGRFWQPDIEWKELEPHMFAAFGEHGWGKVAAGITVVPFGVERSIVVYEARAVMTDDASRARFLRYWPIVGPLVGVILRSVLGTVRRTAEAARPGGSDRQG